MTLGLSSPRHLEFVAATSIALFHQFHTYRDGHHRHPPLLPILPQKDLAGLIFFILKASGPRVLLDLVAP